MIRGCLGFGDDYGNNPLYCGRETYPPFFGCLWRELAPLYLYQMYQLQREKILHRIRIPVSPGPEGSTAGTSSFWRIYCIFVPSGAGGMPCHTESLWLSLYVWRFFQKAEIAFSGLPLQDIAGYPESWMLRLVSWAASKNKAGIYGRNRFFNLQVALFFPGTYRKRIK